MLLNFFFFLGFGAEKTFGSHRPGPSGVRGKTFPENFGQKPEHVEVFLRSRSKENRKQKKEKSSEEPGLNF